MTPVELPKVRLAVAIGEEHFRSAGRPPGDNQLARGTKGRPSLSEVLPAAFPLLSSEHVPVAIKGSLGGWPDTGLHHLPIGAVAAEDAIIAGVIAGPFPDPATVPAGTIRDREEWRPGHEGGEPVRAPDTLPEGSTVGGIGEGNLALLAI